MGREERLVGEAETRRAVARVVLERAAAGLRAQELSVRIAVSAARDAGCTWEEVGSVWGITRQAAQQRFGGTRGATGGG